MPNEHDWMEQARSQAKRELSQDDSFLQLSRAEQFEHYKNRVDSIYHALVNQAAGNADKGGLATQQTFSGAMSAADQINKKQLQNDRIDNQGEIAGRLLDRVNFPTFVKDLLKSVFDANIDVTNAQMHQYADLVNKIVKPASEFLDTIDDNAAKLFIAQQQPHRFQLQETGDDDFGDFDDDSSTDGSGNNSDNAQDQKKSKSLTLLTASGGKVNETELKNEISKAKLALVDQHQKLLEQMLLMGVNRMVVDSGTVKASVDFILQAKEKVQQLQDARENNNQRRIDISNQMRRSGFFSSRTESTSHSNIETSLELSTAGAASVALSQSRTKLHGEVEINFKSDYFPLSNFKEILAPSLQQSGQATKEKAGNTPAPTPE